MEKKRAEVMGSLSLLVVAIIWGSGFIASQMALDAQMSSAFIMFVRFAIAALIVGIVFHKDLKKNMKKEHIKGGLLIGTFLFLAFYVQTVALQYHPFQQRFYHRSQRGDRAVFVVGYQQEKTGSEIYRFLFPVPAGHRHSVNQLFRRFCF